MVTFIYIYICKGDNNMSNTDFKKISYLINRIKLKDERHTSLFSEVIEIVSFSSFNTTQKLKLFDMLSLCKAEILPYLGIHESTIIEKGEYSDLIIIHAILDMLMVWMEEFENLSVEEDIIMKQDKIIETCDKINMLISINDIFENKLYTEFEYFFSEAITGLNGRYDYNKGLIPRRVISHEYLTDF